MRPFIKRCINAKLTKRNYDCNIFYKQQIKCSTSSANGNPTTDIYASKSFDRQKMAAAIAAHVGAEFEAKSLTDTMETMATKSMVESGIAPNMGVNHIPTGMGAWGLDNIVKFYPKHFIGKSSSTMKLDVIDETYGDNVVWQEFHCTLTHDVEMNWLLPNVQPTNKDIEFIIIVKFGFCQDADGNVLVENERIYWDQGTVLTQAGLIDSTNLPVLGNEQAKLVVDPKNNQEYFCKFYK